jgi:hypothetical protein
MKEFTSYCRKGVQKGIIRKEKDQVATVGHVGREK